MSFWHADFISFVYMLSSRNAVLSFLRKLHNVFHNGCTSLHSHNSLQGFHLFHILSSTFAFINFLTVLLTYISYTRKFHCDIFIYTYNVSWLDSPPPSFFLIPSFWLLKTVSTGFITSTKGHQPYSLPFTISTHPPSANKYPPTPKKNRTCFIFLSFSF
jgi:hypothetical protein